MNTSDPANADSLTVNSQGLDTINMAAATSVDVTGTVKLPAVADSLTINTPHPDADVTLHQQRSRQHQRRGSAGRRAGSSTLSRSMTRPIRRRGPCCFRAA